MHKNSMQQSIRNSYSLVFSSNVTYTIYACSYVYRLRRKWPVRYCLLSPDYGVPPSLRIDLPLMMIRYRFCVNGYRQRISSKTYWITKTSWIQGPQELVQTNPLSKFFQWMEQIKNALGYIRHFCCQPFSGLTIF